MRDLVLAGALLAVVLYGMRRPWVAILGWTWVSLMNPHKLSWQLADLPVAMAMAAATFIGLATSKDRKQFFLTTESKWLLAFVLWMCFTLPFSMNFSDSLPLWERIMKIDFMIFVAMMLLHSRKHIVALVWVLAGSVGFYGVKGGIFTVLTGGSYRVWGPEGTYIGGNNEVALALVLVIPLMRFLQLNTESRWIKRGLTASMLLCAAASLGSHSRGALLALATMAFVMWLRGDRKLLRGALLLGVSVVLIGFMPDEWTSRMETIGTYKEDASANGRINAWKMAWNLASDNILGGGFAIYTPENFARYAPDPLDLHAAHSIYFMVLGEQGFIGLFLFCAIWVAVWRAGGRLRRQAKLLPQTAWLSDLGAMAQVSLAGYAVGGAFLSLSYYDLPYNLLVLVVLGNRWIEQKEWLKELPPVPASAGAAKAAA